MSTRGRPTARGASTWLRGYTYVPSMHAYRGPNGRTVARSIILDKLADSIEQREKSIIRHAEALANGQLGGAQYVSLEHLLLKRQGLQEAALAAGGWDRLTPADRGRVGAMLQHDIYPALMRQAQDAAADKLSPAQAVNRAHMMMAPSGRWACRSNASTSRYRRRATSASRDGTLIRLRRTAMIAWVSRGEAGSRRRSCLCLARTQSATGTAAVLSSTRTFWQAR